MHGGHEGQFSNSLIIHNSSLNKFKFNGVWICDLNFNSVSPFSASVSFNSEDISNTRKSVSTPPG